MVSLLGRSNEFGMYAYLSWCLANDQPLPIDLLAILECRGWIIEDARPSVGADAQFTLFDPNTTAPYSGYDYQAALDRYAGNTDKGGSDDPLIFNH